MSEMTLKPNEKLDVRNILKDLDKYEPKRRGWTWRKPAPNLEMGPFTYHDVSEPLKQSVGLPPAKYFGDIDPQPLPVITTEIASGRFEDDIRRMRMAAWHGADHIMVIRHMGQSHIDGLMEGTPQGLGGVPITRKQVRAQRKALDLIEEEVGRPINYHSYVSGVAGPDVAVMFAEEGINGAHQDPQYNVLYRDGKNGPILMKRCAIKGITRDKEYDITKGTPRSEILYMTVNPNGEAEVLKVYFKPRPRLKKVIVDLDFSTLAIKGRQSQGNLFSRYGIHKIVMKERGTSTLGSQEIWFDDDVHRLNTEGRGYALGAFKGEDKLLVWTPRTYYITGYDLQQHFPDDTVLVERYRPERVYAVCYFDREQNYYYLKRFPIESSDKTQFFLDEEGTGDFVCRTGRAGAQLEVTYAGAQASRPAERIEVDGFVGVKSHRAKGKRVTTFEVASLHFVEPEEPEEEPADPATGDDRSGDAPAGGPAVATGAAAANEVGAASGIELPEGPAAVPPQTDDVEFTIERPRGDQDDVIDVEQLNLF